MQRSLAIIIALLVLSMPEVARADTLLATATVSVVVPQMPLSAVMQPGCHFDVTAGLDRAFCFATLLVAQPTVHNAGWSVSVALAGFDCSCGHRLRSRLLSVVSTSPVTVINGQEVDLRGGPFVHTLPIGIDATANPSLMTAIGDYGNGAYSVTLRLSLDIPDDTRLGRFEPQWSLNVVNARP